MAAANRFWIASGLVFLAMGIVKVQAQTPAPSSGNESPPLDGPTIELEPIPSDKPRVTIDRPVPAPKDETRNRRVYASKEPPSPIAERPVGSRPGRRAQWIPGYWEWDPGQSGYVWVGGSWQVTPVGSFWVNTRWVRDEGGWYRVPGYWSRRRDRAVVATELATTTATAWRITGPPADHPDDTPAPAPGPNYFFVPGHYQPAGDRIAWVPGFWARVQPGWDWVPARWVRRPDGWQFREGSWVLDTPTGDASIRRRTTAPPDRTAPPPEPNEPNPPGTEPGEGAVADRLLPPPTPRPDRDDMTDPDAADPGAPDLGDPPVVKATPRVGMPYYVIRPPGSYPYGPGGIIVPGAVPPFVRRLLDRVLP